MRPAISAIVLLLAFLAAPAHSSAQVSDAARAAFAEAERQYNAGNHQLALEGFLRVREMLTDNPDGQVIIGYNIAKCYDRLGRPAEALREYEAYLANAPADAPFRAETQDRVRDLRGRVEAEAASDPSSGASAPAESSALVPAGVAVGAVGAALLIAAIPTGVVALDREAELEATCTNGRCPDAARGVLDDAHLFGTLTDVFWIAGLSVAAIGAALALVGVATEPSESAPAVGAACMEEGCVATLRASF